MSVLKNVEHYTIYKDEEHCINQIATRLLKNGDIIAVYNEERFPYHHDSGQTLIARSTDAGKTWSKPRVVLPWSDTQGNWDCGICEMSDGTLIVNLTITGFFKRGVKPEQPSWSAHPLTMEWGDWTWAYKTQAWLGTYVVKSTDGGESWTQPIPVNVRPLKHGGCRSGCWELPGGSLLMGLYGRIHGYDEEGEGESTRSALMRSDDGGDNWEYYATLAYDPASIIDYEEPGLLRLTDGRLVCFLRTHVNPSGDAKNMVMTISNDDGFSWTPPKWTNIWGYPPELITLQDGRHLMVYGYRRPPYGVRGIISEDGVTWDVKNEFVIREGGVPGKSSTEKPGSSRMSPASGKYGGGQINWDHPGVYQHIGYPSVVQANDGTIVCSYHEWSDDERPLQYVRCTHFRV
ncbi:sialidase family protein [Mesorhizobium sp. CN2-181]|uniref:sialidase family protein n=1 Tax=Mesorhizobium yinganensis TaxID=3157707 RepID=UPI0032B777B0